MSISSIGSKEKINAINDLIEISENYGTGPEVTESEYNQMKKDGVLRQWFKEHDLTFDNLDSNGSNRISGNDVPNFEKKVPGVEKRSEAGDVDPSSASSRSGDSGDSGGVVVVVFGWSDTSLKDTEADLRQAGISENDYRLSDTGGDKGVGIAVVSRAGANRFLDLYNGKKTFAYIEPTVGGVNGIDDLSIKFDSGSRRGEKSKTISFGGGAYGALMTDDPSHVTSGGSGVQGRQSGDDALWTVSGGERGSATLNQGTMRGQEYVTLSASVRRN